MERALEVRRLLEDIDCPLDVVVYTPAELDYWKGSVFIRVPHWPRAPLYMSESPQKILVRQWTSPENDLLNVRNNLAAQEIPWDTICFHSQQAAEKYLKCWYSMPSRFRAPTYLLDWPIPQIQERREALRWLTRLLLPAVIQSRRSKLWMRGRRYWILPKPFAGIASPT